MKSHTTARYYRFNDSLGTVYKECEEGLRGPNVYLKVTVSRILLIAGGFQNVTLATSEGPLYFGNSEKKC